MTKKNTKKKIDDTTVEAVKTLKANNVINQIGDLQVSIQSTLANISGEITNKLAQLHDTEAAIETLENRLNEVYQIEKEALSLEEVKLSRQESDEQYTKMLMARNQERAEQEQNREKLWNRQEEEHNYEVSQRRKKAIDDFNTEVEHNKRTERIRQTDLAQEWANRETALKAKENEFTVLKTQVEGFDARLKSEVSKATAVVENSIKSQYEHKISLMLKDSESAAKMSQSKIEALQIQVGQMHEQIVELNKQLMMARSDAKEVTSQALQSASGRQVAEALAKVVDSKDGKTK